MALHQALLAAAEVLLIGFLIGAQREASRDETEQQPGVRDFTLIALLGAFCVSSTVIGRSSPRYSR
jgi:hypothetical protein